MKVKEEKIYSPSWDIISVYECENPNCNFTTTNDAEMNEHEIKHTYTTEKTAGGNHYFFFDSKEDILKFAKLKYGFGPFNLAFDEPQFYCFEYEQSNYDGDYLSVFSTKQKIELKKKEMESLADDIEKLKQIFGE